MYWDEKNRQWRPHPMCRCHREPVYPCICLNLPPLNGDGVPLGERGVLGSILDSSSKQESH